MPEMDIFPKFEKNMKDRAILYKRNSRVVYTSLWIDMDSFENDEYELTKF
jgi:hypothetical protein